MVGRDHGDPPWKCWSDEVLGKSWLGGSAVPPSTVCQSTTLAAFDNTAAPPWSPPDLEFPSLPLLPQVSSLVVSYLVVALQFTDPEDSQE